MADDAQDTTEGPGESKVKASFERIAAELRQETNWFARKRRLMDLLLIVEVAIAKDASLEDLAAPADLSPTRGQFIDIVPGFLAKLLHELGETEVTSCEQAAFYLLSAREEHQEMAAAWLDADPRHAKALRKFIKANRAYRRLLEDGIAHRSP